MELHAVNWKFTVLQAHNFSGISLGRDLERLGQGIAFRDERMVTRCFQWFGEVFENAAIAMMYLRCFAVHDFISPNNVAAKNLRDALMTETNAENWNFRAELSN